MLENNETPHDGENSVNTETNKDSDPDFINEAQRYSIIETLTIAGLVAIAVASSFYLYTNNILHLTTMGQLLVYMIAMISAPSAFFLLIVHSYSLYRSATTGKKPIFILLDLFYFCSVVLLSFTIVTLFYFYSKNQIAIKFLTPGWMLAAILLFVEVALIYTLTRWFMISKVAPMFSHLFPNIQSTPITKKPVKTRTPVKHVYYYTREPLPKIKQNITIWQNNPCYVKYEHKKEHHRMP